MTDEGDRPQRDTEAYATVTAPTMSHPPPDTEAPTVAAPAATDAPTARLRPAAAGRAPPGPPDDVTIETPGRYALEKEQGRGGQARVLLAYDRHVGREIAWKELLPEWAAGGAAGTTDADPFARRFLREARITAQLEHPNIVPVHEIGRSGDGKLYYTMRLVRGETMAQKLDHARSLADRLKLLGPFWDVCNAVAYAHDRGVIHRDLKPGNVMVGEFGETVVLDWGLAKVRGKEDIRGAELERRRRALDASPERTTSASAGETVDGSALGTPWYMSPEQAVGRVDAMDERSDVWGLGAVLYEILTGRPPHDGDNAAAVVCKVLVEPVRPVRERCPTAPPELTGIADKCLRRDKDERYASARELAADVSAYMTGGRVQAYAYSSWELLRRFAARNKAALAAAAAVLLVILAALVAVLFAWRSEAAARGRERAAHLASEHNLAQAHVQQAERLLDERRFLAARVHALASLLHNPAHPGSLDPDPAFAAGSAERDRPRMEALSVVYRTAYRHIDRLERTLHAPDAVIGADLSPDGRRIASGDGGGWLTVWNADDGRELYRRRAFEDRVWVAVFSPDDARIAVGGRADKIRVYDATRGEPLVDMPCDALATTLAWSPDGRRLASGHATGEIRIWETTAGTQVATLPPHPDEVRGLAWSPDGRWLASGSWDKTARLVEPATGTVRATLAGHTDGLYGVAFSPDGTRLATASYDGTVRLWDVPDGRLAATLNAGGEAVLAVAFSPDGRLLLGGGVDRTLRLWDVADGTLRMAIEGHRDAIRMVAFSSDGRRVVSGSQDGTIRLWTASPDDGLLRLDHPDGAYAVAWSPDGSRIATGGWDRNVRLWNATTGAVEHTLVGHTDGVTAVAFSPDGTRLASGGYDATVRLWDVRSGAVLHALAGHAGPVLRVVFSPDGALLASASHDRHVRLWNVAAGTPVAELPDHGGFVYGADFSPDGRRLATTSFDHAVRVWDVATRRLERELRAHDDWVTDVVFSHDGRWLLSTGKDRACILWDAGSWREARRFVGHDQWVNRGAFTPDGERVVTGGDDGFAFVWDTATGIPLLRIGAGRAIQGVALSPDGRRVALGDPRAAVVYPLDLPSPAADVRGLLREAEAAAGSALRGFRLEVADGP